MVACMLINRIYNVICINNVINIAIILVIFLVRTNWMILYYFVNESI